MANEIEWKRKRAGLHEASTEFGTLGVLKTLEGWVPTIEGLPTERPSRTAEIAMRLAENVIHAKRVDAKNKAKREHVAAGGGLIFRLSCTHDLHLARPTPIEVAATVGRSAMCPECEAMRTIKVIDPRPAPVRVSATTAASRGENVAQYVEGAASDVLVGDRVREIVGGSEKWRAVVGTSRLEAGVEITLRDFIGGSEHVETFSPDDGVVYATALRSVGGLVYRIEHPRKRGIAIFVSVPE